MLGRFRAALVLAVVLLPWANASADCVVLLHGLARSASSMEPVARKLRSHGFVVANVDYPSRDKPIEELAPLAIEAGIAECGDEQRIHFVTHSMGGILVRYYLGRSQLPRLGRVVMLAPPNQGSEVVDRLRTVPGFAALNGPAGAQLGTDDASLPRRLGPVDFELGVIAGTATFNPMLSQLLPNPDDGKVSVQSTKVAGMSDFVEVQRSHPFLMRAPEVLEQIVNFIERGAFKHSAP